eukprot:scaffold57119_cov67-Phaeocystis_antarctica.AAC.2
MNGAAVRDQLHGVARLGRLAVVRLAVLVAQHLLPALPDELSVAVVDRADKALEDERVAARRALAPLEEIALVGT